MVENLNFAFPPGNNSETSWGNAVRAMYPSYGGTTLAATWTNGQVSTYTFKGKMPAFIRDKTQVRFVAFLQNATTKQVQQAAISNYNTFNIDLATTGVQGSFSNCYSSQYTPVVNLTNNGTHSISSCHISRFLDNIFIDSTSWTGSLAANSSTTTSLSWQCIRRCW